MVPDQNLTLEVQQQLGDGVVRTIAMGSSEGLPRHLPVENTGDAIKVPVGKETLGARHECIRANRLMSKDLSAKKARLPIHRSPPTFAEQALTTELLETGIKVIDLVCPFAKGWESRFIRWSRCRKNSEHDGVDPKHCDRT